MRVIAGIYKGRRLESPKGYDIRPTTDKTKEAIFSILTNEIPDSRVLDLYSGTGALGIEALSRGARYCVFCEKSREALSLIHENLAGCDIRQKRLAEMEKDPAGEGFAVVLPGEIEKSITRLESEFDVILMDPPYEKGLCQETLGLIAGEGLLAEDGIIVCEHRKEEDLPDSTEGFVKVKERRYGISKLAIYMTGSEACDSAE